MTLMRHVSGAARRDTTRAATRRDIRAFTLVELLIVVAIIGMLLMVLLPAVQAAREASRRVSCQNKLATLAKALLVYEATNLSYPVGAHNSQWITWVVQLAPFFEAKEIFDRYTYDPKRLSPETRFNSEANKAVTQRFLTQLACPSDGFSPIRTTMENEPSAHNYVANTGNGAYVATLIGWLTMPPAGTPGTVPAPGYGNGMLRWQGGPFVMSGATKDMVPAEDRLLLQDPKKVKAREVKRGLTKTLGFSEVIRRPPQADGRSADYRGLSWWGPGSLFSTINPPNASYPDTLPRAGDCGPRDDDLEPPCFFGNHGRSLPIVVAARSRHRGGVVVSFLDGHAAFVSDSVEADVWESIGTTQGPDVPNGEY